MVAPRLLTARGKPEATLNITSLMDILTIILIFLLFSFSTQDDEVSPPKAIVLPASTVKNPVRLAVRVTMLPDHLEVEGRTVVRLSSGRLLAQDINGNNHIEPLLRALRQQKPLLQPSATSRGLTSVEEDESEIVYLEADQRTPYRLIKQVLQTAAAAGFTKFRLAVTSQG